MPQSHVNLDIAGLLIDFCTRHPDYVRERCREYLATEERISAAGAAPLGIEASDEDILKADRDRVGAMEAELYAMTIPLSELCPGLGRLMTHGVAIECGGRGFIFTAESGVGKSTHAFLWQKYLGEDKVRVINGDKPILWFRDDGRILVCGSPWSGKERLDKNVQVPLGGICLLRRLDSAEGRAIAGPLSAPCIFRATREEAFDFLMHQIYIPSKAQDRLATFALLEQLYAAVPVYHLVADMSRDAVMVASQCLLNNKHHNI